MKTLRNYSATKRSFSPFMAEQFSYFYGRDSLDDSEEERLYSLQLTDNQWADFYPNSPLTDWRIHFTPPFTPPLFRTSCAKFVFSPRFDTFSSRVWHFSVSLWHFFQSSVTFGRLLCYFFNKLCYFSVLLGDLSPTCPLPIQQPPTAISQICQTRLTN